MARTYLAYVDCTNRSGEKMTVACAFTNGDADNLFVGRNGLFYDRQGRDWDATIVKIVDHPISIRQAFWSPYKKLLRWIEETVARRAATADADANARMQAMAAAAAAEGAPPPAVPAAPAAPPPAVPPKPKLDVGVVAALGVAVGAIGTAISALVTGVLKLPGWQLPLVFAGLLLVISGPAMIIAWLKLRKRNLGPILDANGWAVNAKARINLPFGGSLTAVAELPPGSERDLSDPYADQHSGRNRFIALVVLLLALWALWNFGVVEKVAPNVFPKSKRVQQREAAAKEKAAAEAAAAAVAVAATSSAAPAAVTNAPAATK
jgi:MFS family permease